MYQLATQGGGFGPSGFGMPAKDANNKKTYVYDIDHRSDTCIATVKIMDLSSIPVSIGVVCPVSTGASIGSATGGVVVGYDMYGQYITETVAAAGTSDTCFMSVVSAPDDALWTNNYGLPYTHLSSTNGVPTDVAYFGPTNLNKRGSFAYAGADDEVTLNYVVNRVNMFGDARDEFATTVVAFSLAFDAVLTQSTGVIVITTGLIPDNSATVTYTFPDGSTVTAANEVGTVTHTLSPLYMSQYGRLSQGDKNIDGMVRGASTSGTSVRVDITGVVAQIIPPTAPVDPVDPEDPSTLPEPYNFTTHQQANDWLDEFTTALGIGTPLDWSNQSLSDKRASAQDLYDAHT